jgi:hypothetical protein
MSRPTGDDPVPGLPDVYEIRVRGVLDSGWSSWFDGLELSNDQAGQTTITGPLVDQAALHGLLAKVRDLGLPLLSVRRIDPEP